MLPKVFVYAPKEDWILDRWAAEWREFCPDMTAASIEEADIIWLYAEWQWRSIPRELLTRKRLVVMIQHITPEKFTEKERADFHERDPFVYAYHVPCRATESFVRALTNKPVHRLIHWVNHRLWFPISDRHQLRRKYNVPTACYLVGSFQRDTEGYDLASPKLEKGPDLFVEGVKRLRVQGRNLHVVLGGWRRQYVMRRLNEESIPFSYFEKPSNEALNELYNLLDLYVVSSRVEGGPQAIVECAAARVPIVSTPVGIAEDILAPCSIYRAPSVEEAIPDIDWAERRVASYLTAAGTVPFRRLFCALAR